jgi:hypothetical protein
MAHPFTKMFDKALKKSTPIDNQVLIVAEKLRAKGYSPEEIGSVLKKLHKSLIQPEDSEIVGEAVEEFSQYLESEEDND